MCKENKMRSMTIRIPESTHRALKIISSVTNTDMRTIIVSNVNKYILDNRDLISESLEFDIEVIEKERAGLQ